MTKKVLLLLGGKWHPFESCGEILDKFLSNIPGWELVTSSDPGRFRKLDGFDAVVVYTQGGTLTAAQEKGLLEFVRNGGGFVGIHCANDSFMQNEGYMEMIGTEFAGHGPMCPITVQLDGNCESIVPRVARQWVETDEFYILKPRTSLKKLDVFQYGGWEFDSKMLGYVRQYGKGRVFYTGLGHDERQFNNPNFQNLILKALRYVTGEKERTLRWGIVGYGPAFGMGTHHADFIKKTAGMKMAAVCDRDKARVEAAKKEQGEDLQYFTDAKDLIASGCCDGVTTIVPHNVHATVAVPLLEAGLHVITEKPFAITPAECDAMIGAARKSGAVLSVYHSRHWDADMWTLCGIVKSGAIGQVFAIEHNMCEFSRQPQWWRADKQISGGIMYDMGAHGFEKIFQIVPRKDDDGKPINRKAFAFGNFFKKIWWDTTNEDYARAYVRFDTGLEAMLTQSSMHAAVKPEWIVSGTKGSCVSTGQGVELKQFVDGAMRTTMVPYVEGLNWHSFYLNFADHLFAGVPLVITPELAKATIQCIHGAEVASRENRLVELNFEF